MTTGDVARLCHVSPRTVSKWVDTGKLRGYCIPGSRDRRIPVNHLISFMRAHEMPLDDIDAGTCRILVVGDTLPCEIAERLVDSKQFEVQVAGTSFNAGVQVEQTKPHVIILNVDGNTSDAIDLCKEMREHSSLEDCRIIAAATEPSQNQQSELITNGFDVCISKPYTLGNVLKGLETTINLIR